MQTSSFPVCVFRWYVVNYDDSTSVDVSIVFSWTNGYLKRDAESGGHQNFVFRFVLFIYLFIYVSVCVWVSVCLHCLFSLIIYSSTQMICQKTSDIFLFTQLLYACVCVSCFLCVKQLLWRTRRSPWHWTTQQVCYWFLFPPCALTWCGKVSYEHTRPWLRYNFLFFVYIVLSFFILTVMLLLLCFFFFWETQQRQCPLFVCDCCADPFRRYAEVRFVRVLLWFLAFLVVVFDSFDKVTPS